MDDPVALTLALTPHGHFMLAPEHGATSLDPAPAARSRAPRKTQPAG